jgi:hypothetical protein
MRLALAFVGALLLIAAVSCGGGDSKPTATLGPVGSKVNTPTPTPAASEPGDGGSAAPDPIEPTLDEALTLITSDSSSVTLGPGEIYAFDSQALAETAGTTPNCSSFQFDFSWQVQDPYPPDGITMQWQIERNGADVKVAEGVSGEQSVGCETVDLVNTSQQSITVAVKYKLGGTP